MGESTGQTPRTEGSSARTVRFSAAGARAGFVECVPVAVGVAGYGVVFGVLARQAGLSVAEAVFMSATVLAGVAQVVAVELWDTPIPAVAVVGTTFVVNLRYALMGAALRPWFGSLSTVERYVSVFFMADENWALTMRTLRSGSDRGAYLLGTGLAIWAFWVVATALGALAGGGLVDPARYGLGFALTAVFVAIATDLWDGTEHALPWGVAACVAVVTSDLLPGRWYILLGGIAGSLVEVVRFGR